MSNRGDVLVVWREGTQLLQAGHAPGRPFGDPEILSPVDGSDSFLELAPRVAFDATSNAVVIWHEITPGCVRSVIECTTDVKVARRPFEQSFSSPIMVADQTQYFFDPTVTATSAQGEAVVFWPSGAGPQYSLFTTPEPAIPPPTVIPAPTYIGLGDSVAAGEGLNYGWKWTPQGGDGSWLRAGSDEPSWDGDPQACHQSIDSYPHLVRLMIDASLVHLACTGSTANNGVLAPRNVNGTVIAPAQLGNVYSDNAPSFVSLTVGANDIDFANELAKCYGSKLSEVLGDCSTDETNRRITDALAAEKVALRSVLQEVESRGADAGVLPLVAVTTYYDPFPNPYRRCKDIFPTSKFGFHIELSNTEVQFLRGKLAELNKNISEVVGDFGPGFALVDLSGLVQPDHAFCSGDPWIFGPSIRLPDEYFQNPAPFHPTSSAQWAIAEKIVQVFSGARTLKEGTNVETSLNNGIAVSFSHILNAGIAAVRTAASGFDCPAADSFASLACFDLSTSAHFDGPVTIRIPSAEPLDLFHFADGQWHKVSSVFDGSGVIGSVESLSPLALGLAVPKVTVDFEASGDRRAPAEMTFQATGKSAVPNDDLLYRWDFGDGTSGQGAVAGHSYSVSGTYRVRVTITTGHGAVAEVSQDIAITNERPLARISGPLIGTVGASLTVEGTGSGDPNGQIVGWLWNFGDGSSETEGITASHTYADPGKYLVTLTVFDNEGETGSASYLVDIQGSTEPPSAITDPGSHGGPTPGGQSSGGSGSQNQTQPVHELRLTKLALSTHRFHVRKRGRRGAHLTFRLSRRARVELFIERRAVQPHACRPANSAKVGSNVCVYWKPLRGRRLRRGKRGGNTVNFSVRWQGRSLKPGKYILAAVAMTSDNISVTRTVRFTVLP